MKISAVVNTYNEEKNIKRCLESLKNFADEIVVVDMHSGDKTIEIAKRYTDKIFSHEYTRYVEPARNFALRQASHDWILLIDADEELSPSLAKQLKKIAKEKELDFVEIPRKNIIFDRWMEHSRWWPDYLVRFFKKGKVEFSKEIHIPPQTKGKGIKLEVTEENALIHYNFQTISQYLERLDRYTDIQTGILLKNGYQFAWGDLITKPAGEFLSRFFAGEGYKDGIHGLALALLQAFSELVLYLKMWEKQGFPKDDIKGYGKTFEKTFRDFYHWQQKITPGLFKKIYFKIKAKINE